MKKELSGGLEHRVLFMKNVHGFNLIVNKSFGDRIPEYISISVWNKEYYTEII